jgi:hypothetical protein
MGKVNNICLQKKKKMCDISNVHKKEMGLLNSPTIAVEISVDKE